MIPYAWPDPTAAQDMSSRDSVTIWCLVAPTSPWTIQGSPDGDSFIAQTAVSNTPSGIASGATISGIGRYDLPGHCRYKLSGGVGGTFKFAGDAE